MQFTAILTGRFRDPVVGRDPAFGDLWLSAYAIGAVDLGFKFRVGQIGTVSPTAKPRRWTPPLRAGARAVNLVGPSVYQGGPKFEIKRKRRCLQKIKLVNWGVKHVDWGAWPPWPFLSADSAATRYTLWRNIAGIIKI